VKAVTVLAVARAGGVGVAWREQSESLSASGGARAPRSAHPAAVAAAGPVGYLISWLFTGR
jgi:hypothetical protein